MDQNNLLLLVDDDDDYDDDIPNHHLLLLLDHLRVMQVEDSIAVQELGVVVAKDDEYEHDDDAVVGHMEATVPCEANHSNVDGEIHDDDQCCYIHHHHHMTHFLLHSHSMDDDDKDDVVEDDVPSVPLLDLTTRR